RRGANRLLLARALCLVVVPFSAGGAQGQPVRGRRSALRVGVGARLPPRLPAPAWRDRPAGVSGRDGADRDRDRTGGGGNQRAPAAAGPVCRALGLRPAEPVV